MKDPEKTMICVINQSCNGIVTTHHLLHRAVLSCWRQQGPLSSGLVRTIYSNWKVVRLPISVVRIGYYNDNDVIAIDEDDLNNAIYDAYQI